MSVPDLPSSTPGPERVDRPDASRAQTNSMTPSRPATQAPRTRLRHGSTILALLALWLASAPPTNAATRDFTPVADTYVSEQNPETNYGDAGFLNTRDGAGTDFIGYMRFDLAALRGHTIRSATLVLYCSVGTHTLSIHAAADNDWSEHGLNWNNAPELGSVVAARAVGIDAWESFDVTDSLGAGDRLSLAFWSNLNSYRRIASKESATPPRLTVTFDNQPPSFPESTITVPGAAPYQPYAGAISGAATDSDGDTLHYSLSSGPAWLNVAPDGALSGAPAASDVGLNRFTIQVSDQNGGVDVADLQIEVAPPAGRLIFSDDFSQESGLLGTVNGWAGTGPEDKEYNLNNSGALVLRDQNADEKGSGTHAGYFDTIFADLGAGARLANDGDWIELSLDFAIFGDPTGANAVADDGSGLRISLTQSGLTADAGFGVFVGTGSATTHSFREMRNAAAAQSTLGDALINVDIPEGDSATTSLVFRLTRVDGGVHLSGTLGGHELTPHSTAMSDLANLQFNTLGLSVATRDHALKIDNVAVRIPETAGLWNQFVQARSAGAEPVLPDFSHAGYQHGNTPIPSANWTVFDVTNYGAIPNDGVSDKIAIEAAIAAATSNGSGIVFFPPGQFRINDVTDPHNQPIDIAGDRIVLRGSGRGPGGTVLFAERHMDPTNPTQLWTSPYVLRFKGFGKRTGTSSAVVADSARETHVVTVADASLFRPGDWVVLHRLDNSPQAVAEAVAPYTADPDWTSLVSTGVRVEEIHLISEIDENTIAFVDPIHANVTSAGGWSVILYDAIEEVGVEDLAFKGNWQGDFVHHRSFLDDGGWSGLSFSAVVNSWIRNCRFTDWSRALTVGGSAAVSVIDLKIDGNPGHNALTLSRCTHCFVGMIDDTADHHHANGVSGWCSGNVFWKTRYEATTSFESHASQPRCTLFDHMTGGFLYGRWGGSVGNQPNHLHHLVFWNFENIGATTPEPFQFMRSDSVYGRLIMPYVVGFHGAPQEFAASQVAALESNGAPVQPASLYQAQYQMRTGRPFTRLIYDQWIARHGLNGAAGDPAADLDADHRSNLVEYGIGGDPSQAASLESAQLRRNETGPLTEISYVYRRRRDAAARGLSYTVEHSDQLNDANWTSLGVSEVMVRTLDDDFESVTARILTEDKAQGFLRLRVRLQD